LRERQGDIPLLVRHFAQQFFQTYEKVIETIRLWQWMPCADTNGRENIRELQNVIERAVIISTGPALSVDVSDLKIPKDRPCGRRNFSEIAANGALHDVLEQSERQQILKALEQCNWVVAGLNGQRRVLA